MKPEDSVRQFYQKIVVKTDPETDARVLEKVLAAHETTITDDSNPNRSHIRSTIMKNPIIKLAIAAVVVVAVLIGITQLGGSTSGVAWGQVAEKVQATSGLILRIKETGSVSLDDDDYAIKYFSPAGSRSDAYKDGKIVRSHYSNYGTKTSAAVFHGSKRYVSRQHTESSEGFLEQDQDWTNPKYLVQQIVSVEHKELGTKTIDGVQCEGLETSDPAVMGRLKDMVSSLEVHMELWVDTQTQYPVRFEGKITGQADGETLTSRCTMDQFQWDMDLDPSLFEPNIPADYQPM